MWFPIFIPSRQCGKSDGVHEYAMLLYEQDKKLKQGYTDEFGPIRRIESYDKDNRFRRIFRGDKAFLVSRQWNTEELDPNQEPDHNAWFIRELEPKIATTSQNETPSCLRRFFNAILKR